MKYLNIARRAIGRDPSNDTDRTIILESMIGHCDIYKRASSDGKPEWRCHFYRIPVGIGASDYWMLEKFIELVGEIMLDPESKWQEIVAAQAQMLSNSSRPVTVPTRQYKSPRVKG